MTSTSDDRQRLRQEIRAKRRSLSTKQQSLAAQSLCDIIVRQPVFKQAQHIGLYVANDGEIDPSKLLAQTIALEKNGYLPVLEAQSSLQFFAFTQNTPMKPNRFGIPEPTGSVPISRDTLDIVFMPLVAFDHTGARLGMGGGFYDRTFAFKTALKTKPMLIGLAHAIQQVPRLDVESWDIPLEAIVTDQGVITCRDTKESDFLLQDYVEQFSAP